ncbi:MAG: DUF488 domain-containing protein [Methylohalobius sp.]|nr:DUF488 domain-containing protein [Methylohalobius sp.]
MRSELYTIGHCNHGREEFLHLLTQHGITALADVRSVPYSRRHPQYNRETLKDWLKEHGIAYVFLGDQLGGRSQDPADFTAQGYIDYERLKRKPSFQQGIERLRRGLEQYKIALMCAEKDPLNCHRGLLIAPELERIGIAVVHILADGSLERHRPQTENRLLPPEQQDCFSPYSEQLHLAYQRRAAEAAYRKGV